MRVVTFLTALLCTLSLVVAESQQNEGQEQAQEESSVASSLAMATSYRQLERMSKHKPRKGQGKERHSKGVMGKGKGYSDSSSSDSSSSSSSSGKGYWYGKGGGSSSGKGSMPTMHPTLPPTPSPPITERDVVFLGIFSAYSGFKSQLVLTWDEPIFIQDVCPLKPEKPEKPEKPPHKPHESSSKRSKSSKASKGGHWYRDLQEIEEEDKEEQVLYHVFLEPAPFDFFEGGIESLFNTSMFTTTNLTDITFDGLPVNTSYTALVIASIGDLILSNENNVTVTISSLDATLKDDVEAKPIPPSYIITRKEWQVVENVTMDDDPGDPPEFDPELDVKEEMEPPNEETVYNITIIGPDPMSLGIMPEHTITGTVTETGEPFVLLVGNITIVNSTAIVIHGVDSYPTNIFETLDVDFQIDAFYDEAEDRIRESCDEYYEMLAGGSTVAGRVELEKTFSFNFVDIDVSETDNSTAVTVGLQAKLTAYLKVRVKINGKGFESELGAGYDYLFGAGISVEIPQPDPVEGEDTLWEGKQKRLNLFTIPPGIPIWITWQPFLAYDYFATIEAQAGASIAYQVSGGDYAALVVKGNGISTKRETSPQERTDPGDILSIDEDCGASIDAGVGIRLGLMLKFWNRTLFTAEPAVRAGIDVRQRVTCNGTLEDVVPPAPSGSRFLEEPDETRAISPTSIPALPLRVKEFDVDFRLSIPITFMLRVCFELKIKIDLGFLGTIKIEITICLLKIDAEVEIDLFTLSLLTLPEPKLDRQEYRCIDDALMLDVGIEKDSDEGSGIIPNGLFDSFSSWVLLFNDTEWSTTSQPSLNGIQGTIDIISGGDDFCCGVASMPKSDLFLVTTQIIPLTPNPYGLISYAGTQSPDDDDALCKLLQKCSLEEFYNVAIGDEICAIENCTWKLEDSSFGPDYCEYNGVTCDDGNAIILDRNTRPHSRNSFLPEEIQYLKYLERLDLGFKPFCAESEEYSCLFTFEESAFECVKENCTDISSVIDDETGEECLVEPMDNTTTECVDTCTGGGSEYATVEVCTDYVRMRPEENKMMGSIPAALWSMGETKGYPLEYVDLSGNAFTSIDDPVEGRPKKGTLDLRNNTFPQGYNLPCDICDFFENIYVDCDGDDPKVNCYCCVEGLCSDASRDRHDQFCFPSAAPSMAPSEMTEAPTEAN